MSASLVGSEMCIRDRAQGRRDAGVHDRRGAGPQWGRGARAQGRSGAGAQAVSYTHLTLPTICSV
eukprot:12609683-Alexandrium_andersonii.AAC.1